MKTFIAAAACLLCIGYMGVYAQFDDQSIKTVFDKSELKQYEKSMESIDDADDLITEANQNYVKVNDIKTQEDTSDKKVQKGIRKLLDEATSLQSKAYKEYKKGYDLQYEVLKKVLTSFWDSNPAEGSELVAAKEGEELAADYRGKAKGLEHSAVKLDEDEKSQELIEAINTYKLSLNELEKSVRIVYGLETESDSEYYVVSEYDEKEGISSGESTNYNTYGGTDYSEDSQSIPDSVLVNDELLDIYLRLREDDAYNLPDSVRYYLSNNFTWAQIQNRWYAYLSNPTPDQIREIKTSQTTDKEYPEVMDEDAHLEVERKEKTTVKNYYIQLPADQKPLSQATLQGLYYGGKEVKMKRDNGNYIYTIESFDSFQDAENYKKKVGLTEGLILANEKKEVEVSQTLSQQESKTTQSSVSEREVPLPTENILFYVQIAASKIPLTVDYLNEKYKGNKTVHVRNEDGWFKYQLGGTKYYYKAQNILESTDIQEAFIVAYENGKLQNLLDARQQMEKINRTTLPKDMRFSVQLAASRRPLSKAVLGNIYKGQFPVNMVIEDGWYKYQIMAGNSFSNASQIKQTVNVKGAFIVGYANGEKKLLY